MGRLTPEQRDAWHVLLILLTWSWLQGERGQRVALVEHIDWTSATAPDGEPF